MTKATLVDLKLKQAYRSGSDEISTSFFAQALSVSTSYDRAVGYFSTSILAVSPVEYAGFFLRGGTCRLLCSPDLSPADWAMLSDSVDLDDVVLTSISETLASLANEPSGESARALFATLIKLGHVEIRLIIPREGSGIFHEKVGIFTDDDGARVSFIGSVNETYNAWRQNIESFEVFNSANHFDRERISRHSSIFESSWNDECKESSTYKISEAVLAEIVQFAEDDLNTAVASARRDFNALKDKSFELRDYQDQVLENWKLHNYQGVISFATGAGKTLTALEGFNRLVGSVNTAIVVVPTVALQDQWIDEIRKFPFRSTPAVAALGGKRVRARLSN